VNKFKVGESVKRWHYNGEKLILDIEPYVVVEVIERRLYYFYRVRNVHGHEYEAIEANIEAA